MIIIQVPDMNDSVCSVNIKGKVYRLRFTYNSKFDYWSFGIRTQENEPIAEMIKIVPNYPLTYHITDTRMPDGDFGCITEHTTIGRNDFKEGRAKFVFFPRGE